MFFVADGSALINAIYDWEGFNEGKYGDTEKLIPQNDNAKWALDVIAEALMSTLEGEEGQPAENALVIFDESRHPQKPFSVIHTTRFLLVYFTGEGLAMLALFVVLFITFEAVLLKKRSEPGVTFSALFTTDLVMQIGTRIMPKPKNPAGVLVKGS